MVIAGFFRSCDAVAAAGKGAPACSLRHAHQIPIPLARAVNGKTNPQWNDGFILNLDGKENFLHIVSRPPRWPTLCRRQRIHPNRTTRRMRRLENRTHTHKVMHKRSATTSMRAPGGRLSMTTPPSARPSLVRAPPFPLSVHLFCVTLVGHAGRADIEFNLLKMGESAWYDIVKTDEGGKVRSPSLSLSLSLFLFLLG